MEKVLEQALPQVTKTEVSAPAAPPVEPSGGFPWGGVGYGILIVAVVAIATKILSD